jgi:FdhE protein
MAHDDAAPSPWAAHRRRALALRERYPFADELLSVYLALVDVWDEAWDLARQDRPDPRQLPAWTAERVLPRVAKVTEATGPEPLASATRALVEEGRLDEVMAAWLAGDGLQSNAASTIRPKCRLSPVERYLARASLRAPLAALGDDAAVACAADPAPRDDRHCPRCGGPPQLSFRSAPGEALVTGRRQLECVRCGQSWAYSASTCPSCGETTGAKRTMYGERRDGPVVRDAPATDMRGRPVPLGRARGSEDDGPTDPPTFPHVRVDACTSCQRYLVDVDLGIDPKAVPEVDELAALPLDLYAVEQGLSKITPNLMGF